MDAAEDDERWVYVVYGQCGRESGEGRMGDAEMGAMRGDDCREMSAIVAFPVSRDRPAVSSRRALCQVQRLEDGGEQKSGKAGGGIQETSMVRGTYESPPRDALAPITRLAKRLASL